MAGLFDFDLDAQVVDDLAINWDDPDAPPFLFILVPPATQTYEWSVATQGTEFDYGYPTPFTVSDSNDYNLRIVGVVPTISATSGQTITVGQASETDTAQAVRLAIPTFVGIGNPVADDSGSPVSPGIPDDAVEGDLLLLHILGRGDATEDTPQAGGDWYAIDDLGAESIPTATNGSVTSGVNSDSARHSVFYCFYTEADPPATTVPAASPLTMAVITAWRYCHAEFPIAMAEPIIEGTNTTTHSYSGVAVPEDDHLLIASMSIGDNEDPTWTYPTETIFGQTISDQGGAHLGIAYNEDVDTGTTDDIEWTLGAAEEAAGWIILLRPVGGSAPQTIAVGQAVETDSANEVSRLFTNILEGGTDGVTITTGNSGGASGHTFSLVQGSPTFEADAAYHGTMGYACADVATQTAAGWSGLNSMTQRASVYVKFGSLAPAVGMQVIQWRTAANSIIGSITLNTNGRIVFQHVGGTITTGTNIAGHLLPDAAKWYRIDCEITIHATTSASGTLHYAVYDVNSADTNTALFEFSGAATLGTTAADAIRFGPMQNSLRNSVWYLDTVRAGSGSTTPFGMYVPPAKTIVVRQAPSVGDDFNRADGGLGSNWTTFGSFNDPAISSNQAIGRNVLAENSAEGGSNGTTVTVGNSGGASGTPWEIVSIAGSSTLVYNNTTPIHDSLSYLITSNGGAAALIWNSDGALGSVFTSGKFCAAGYIDFTTGPSSSSPFMLLTEDAAGGARVCDLRVLSTGVLDLRGTAQTSVVALTTAGSITGGSVFRWELELDLDTSPTGYWVAVYSGHSTTPLQEASGTSALIGAQVGRITFGRVQSPEFTVRMDSLAVDTVRLGPITTPYGAYWNADSFTNDQSVEVDADIGSAISLAGVYLRSDTSGDDAYYAVWDSGNGGQYRLGKKNSGTETDLDTVTGVGVTFERTLRLEAVGTALTFYVDGNEVCSATDSDHTSGEVGWVLHRNTSGSGYIDNWSGGGVSETAQAITARKTKAIGQASETDTAQTVVRPSGQSAAVGQASETDTAQALTVRKTKAIGQASETDTSQLLTKRKTKLIGQAGESDLSQTITVRRSYTIGQAGEADTAQAITSRKTKALGQTSETDTANAITVNPKRRLVTGATETDTAQTITYLVRRLVGQAVETDTANEITPEANELVNQASETDTAQGITSRKTRTLGQASETDTAQAVTSRKTKALGQSSETDTSQAVTARKTRGVSQATETDTSQAVTRRKIKTIGQTTETDTANAITARKVKLLGQTSETDTSQSITPVKVRATGQASETDTSQALTSRKTRTVGQASEIDTSQAITYVVRRLVGMVSETDTANAITWVIRRLVGQASESDTAQEISSSANVLVNQTSETDTSQAVTRRKTKAIGQTSETDTSNALTARKTKLLGQTSETDSANGVTSRKVKLLGQTSESDTSQPVTARKRVTLGQSSEADSSQPITRVKRISIGQASEADTANAITYLVRRLVGQASETDTAQAITWALRRLVGQASELDTAQDVATEAATLVNQASEVDTSQALTSRKTKLFGQVTETDTSQAITGRKTRTLVMASETGTAIGITVRKSVTVGQAAETDTSNAVTARKSRLLGQVSETDSGFAVTSRKVKAIGQASEADSSQALQPLKVRLLGQVTETDTANAVSYQVRRLVGIVLEADSAQPISFVSSSAINQAIETDTANALTVRKSRLLGQASETDTATTITQPVLILIAPADDSEVDVTDGETFVWDYPGTQTTFAFRRRRVPSGPWEYWNGATWQDTRDEMSAATESVTFDPGDW